MTWRCCCHCRCYCRCFHFSFFSSTVFPPILDHILIALMTAYYNCFVARKAIIRHYIFSCVLCTPAHVQMSLHLLLEMGLEMVTFAIITEHTHTLALTESFIVYIILCQNQIIISMWKLIKKHKIQCSFVVANSSERRRMTKKGKKLYANCNRIPVIKPTVNLNENKWFRKLEFMWKFKWKYI